ncbi:RNA degradosome polyphosphate kinase [Weissella diestrammenae]|uniref:Polyphosphate kinase n=1 Tax=Weissella diestrammenae TaxID=1162633 RepID=A0A7G9T3M3_9LACO|nr:RNA degradosome polyphosphate kinase [Weissella diestrammenae]MCM0582675.1 RNA degradosome polyphosphate kinase [Weissella diestrammenae]QNN74698.1 RNA degradosome polyphosphate kinase [Weissella diestrammenae]
MVVQQGEPYINREVSWLAFNGRVLDEARDKTNPLYERAKFLGITQSNMDEWFQVRVASLFQLRHVKDKVDATGMTPHEQLKLVSKLAGEQINEQYHVLNRLIMPALKKDGLQLVLANELTVAQRQELLHYFQTSVLPILTPMADDQTRPFPFLATDTLNLAVKLRRKGQERFAIVQVPLILNRVIPIPESTNQYILLEELIKAFIEALFVGYSVEAVYHFHILRDMELDIADDEGPNLLAEVQQKLFERERGAVIRLVHEKGMTKKILTRLIKALHVHEERVYSVSGPVDLGYLSELVKYGQNDAERFTPFKGFLDERLADERIFEAIDAGDILLHHPYDSFTPVVNLIHQAAKDPDVLAIKMTLYRVSGNSPIIAALSDAARAGKQVTTLVEVKARFDEENNVHWAQELERQGVHVIYGLKGLKTHAKIALVVRREGDDIKRYVHMGTGNYNDVTAHFYTDMGLLTTNAEIGLDVAAVFNVLTGYSDPDYFNHVYMSPDGIRDALVDQLQAVKKAHQNGQSVKVRLKTNSLSDLKMIDEIVATSQSGVPVEMIVRGISMVEPGVAGKTENLAIHSIVGRLLEHSRIYIFEIAGQQQVFLSSADLMSRNLDRRIELMFPILDEALAAQVVADFDLMWSDNVKTRVLQVDGTWKKVNRRNVAAIDAQEQLIQQSLERQKNQKRAYVDQLNNQTQFQPMNNPFQK